VKYLLDFLNQDLKKSKIYELIKCGDEEGEILKYLSKAYVQGTANMSVFELLGAVFGTQNDKQLLYLKFIKNLLGSGWIVQNYSLFKMPENSQKSSNLRLRYLKVAQMTLKSA